YEDGGCDGDTGCCAGLLCVGFVCVGNRTTGAGSSNGNGNGSNGNGGGRLPLGAECNASSQCSQDGGEVDCAENGLDYDGAYNCCRYTGGVCYDGAGCCVGLESIDGICGGGGAEADSRGGNGDVAVSGGDIAVGGVCASDDECSQEGGPTVCGDNGIYTDGNFNCCRYAGHGCGSDLHCCAGYLCIGGVCSGA
ncbi:MAG: hypothetical protein ACR2J8_11095, partial [Thermomicrobiales bacterium]